MLARVASSLSTQFQCGGDCSMGASRGEITFGGDNAITLFRRVTRFRLFRAETPGGVQARAYSRLRETTKLASRPHPIFDTSRKSCRADCGDGGRPLRSGVLVLVLFPHRNIRP